MRVDCYGRGQFWAGEALPSVTALGWAGADGCPDQASLARGDDYDDAEAGTEDAAARAGRLLASGHEDGSVRLWAFPLAGDKLYVTLNCFYF